MQLSTALKINGIGVSTTSILLIPAMRKIHRSRLDPTRFPSVEPDQWSSCASLAVTLVIWTGLSILWPVGMPLAIADLAGGDTEPLVHIG